MKERNYLKFILITLGAIAVMIILLSLLSLFSKKEEKTVIRGNKLTSNNSVTYYQDSKPAYPIIEKTSPLSGKKEAKVIIAEYNSFGCPYSKLMHQTIEKVAKKYGDQVALVWKDLPLEDQYPGATLAHIASRCAQEQGQFWPYQQALWSGETNFSKENLIKISSSLKLNQEAFSTCLNGSKTIDLINQDIKEADKLMIEATPHIYINQQEIMGIASEQDIEKLIEIEINKK